MGWPLDDARHPEHGIDHEDAGELHRRFSGAQPASSYVPRMNAGDVTVPVPIPAVWGSGAAAVERWAKGLRADLARLAAHLQQLQAEADVAELRSAWTGAGDQGGQEYLPLVDDMLTAARIRVELVLQLAREESSAVVARAMEEAAGTVRSSVARGGEQEENGIVFDGPASDCAAVPDPPSPDASSRQMRDRVRQLAQRTRR